MDKQELIRAAFEARKNSYAPYSHYRVGAALAAADGSITMGCNIENASYGLSNCAERTAIFKAVSEGKKDFTAIAIVGGVDSDTDEEAGDDMHTDGYAFPCGACRQVMREFCSPAEFTVIVASSIDDHKVYKLDELLPCSFGPESIV